MATGERETLTSIPDALRGFLAGHAADFKAWDREGAQPAEFIQELRELGLFGLIIPEEHGGLGLSNAAYAPSSARRVAMTARCRSRSARTAPSA